MMRRNATQATVSYHWRQLSNGSRLTRYFYKLTQKKLNGTISPVEAKILKLLRLNRLVPLHLYISIVSQNGAQRTLRFYGVSDGNAVSTDGSLIGRNNSPILVSYAAYTPGTWRVVLNTPRLSWQSAGITSSDIEAASERLKLDETEPQLVYEHVSEMLINEGNSIVSDCEYLYVSEAQLDALDSLVKSCQSQYHYKLVGNNCQNVAHDILKMIKSPKYKPNWVPNHVHEIYLQKLSMT